ncbi:hypothetical protein QBC33DRAFT_593649 [Phialemonium atrogriseum]|uniref:1-alkyl-2-acetylglycerophosphocholine esterase n=1 Tax=Phialemonium atrogriseum TaxID=1093897 RepID=A0AAJ0BXJ4_9PEZI|nr:uncharacterized protein QBC33DRAFT_593649 [Phialemonium atrogriseum]KAK1764917.1 hypothetical protein QBC33DRAFT_593649 [Phialemonium atrogriseum]
MKLFATSIPTVCVLVAVCCGLLIPEPTGPYKTALHPFQLVDDSRLDPWNSSHPRRIMVSRFDPVPPERCTQTCTVPYMSQFLADSEDAIFDTYLSSANLTWPSGVLSQLELQICCNRASRPFPNATLEYPVVLFSSGLNTTRFFYSAIAQTIASRGYTVVTMDHPYETDIVEFPDGTIVYGGNVVADPNNTAPLVHALDVRTNDASFVLHSLGVPFVTETDDPDTARAAMVGQSFGGAAAAAAMVNDTRLVAGVNLDGMMFGPVLNAGLGRPGIPQSFLVFGSVGHNSSSDDSWGRFLETMHTWHPEEWVKELSVEGSIHGSYADFGVIADVAGWRDDEGLVQALIGDITGARTMEILAAYLDDFLQMALRGEDQGLLNGPSSEFPEVQFLS